MLAIFILFHSCRDCSGLPKQVFRRLIVQDRLPVETVIEIVVEREIRGPPTLPSMLAELAEKKEDDFGITLQQS